MGICSFCAPFFPFGAYYEPDTLDFELKVFGGVTRSPGIAPNPPPGSLRDLCAKCDLYAKFTPENRPENRPQTAEAVKPPFLQD